MNYRTGKYIDSQSGRYRWAVICKKSGVWYFPDSYSLFAAQKLAKELNEEFVRGMHL